ncbi:thiamine phosphate synthase [Ligilactobacillus pobuzihii]|uniref:Thiamine-phosphate synthase n=1 Tax=Ligilactobacillus pobuzihii TaxID=449659 RepID=A0A0R2LFT0_9LACO|nr:thiamine phosphate synthase [Ligilactobacillus pobuzihii]KRK09851.1 thiamine-phosphate diphosphorylase [Ligilactobacillus pobuzihii E100301 = KCTC 13174]KRO00665.1 thiamine-phosphate diphosphorylase [Ligilactobacillus pobuzihii]GEN48584.1 thiamine-phosphate synthase 2 [Ligilactobacillus pobuzihii]
MITDHTNLTDEQFLVVIEKACQAGVDLVQLREKTGSSRELLNWALRVKQLTDKYNVPLIIDDRIDIAQASEAAGVHLGQSDLPVNLARQILGPEAIIGATTKTIEQADIAQAQGADYLGCGAIFPTTTHVKTVQTSIATLTEICASVDLPVYAIGGMRPDRVKTLKNTGAAGVAVVSDLMQASDPAVKVQDFKVAIQDNQLG